MMFNDFDKECMKVALDQARDAIKKNEVPVGAVLSIGNQILTKAHNLVETLQDPTAHAERLVLTEAAGQLNNWRLLDATLYVTLEPCSMCAGACFLSRVKRIVWAAPDIRHGANGSWVDLFENKHPTHNIIIESGLFQDESSELLKTFFKARRDEQKNHKALGRTDPVSAH